MSLMSLPPEFYVTAILSIILTGISKSGFAGGLGVVAVPLMALSVTPQMAAAINLPILVVMDILIIWRYRKSWSMAVILPMMPGALLGLAIGAATFEWAEPDAIRIAVGVMAVAMAARWLLARRHAAQSPAEAETQPPLTPAPKQTGRGSLFALGALSAYASYIAHAGGPPVKGYFLRQRLEKSAFVGTNGMFFFFLNGLKLVSYTALGQITLETAKVSALLSPALIIGVLIGFALHSRIPQQAFSAIVYSLLGVVGLKLLWDGVIGTAFAALFL
ncbi:MAG: sulfite exporter TauE/SafE family protein [Rhodospirillaceae bacterium]